jgi:hypothetical protein
VTSQTLRHLGIAAHHRRELETARQRLEESTRLRRETGNRPGAAASMVGLVYIAAAQGRERDIRVVDTALTDGLSTGTSSPWIIGELNLYRGSGG